MLFWEDPKSCVVLRSSDTAKAVTSGRIKNGFADMPARVGSAPKVRTIKEFVVAAVLVGPSKRVTVGFVQDPQPKAAPATKGLIPTVVVATNYRLAHQDAVCAPNASFG